MENIRNIIGQLTLTEAPRVVEDVPSGAAGVHAMFYEGLPWKGKATRVFTYYGIPEHRAGERVPGIVLVHGGGGSAFIPWVQLWMSRGYAAIAMDTCGCISGGGDQNHICHVHGGPSGWGGFDQIDESVEDQWTFHAVADVILAHSLLRSFPQVDPDRIGLTGVSWGGYLTCITAGIDNRFGFAAPVYGCGFLGDNSKWLGDFEKMGPDRARRWLAIWDPSVYLARVRIPMLWVSGTNDFAYPMDSLQRSYRLPSTARTICLRVDMPHGHGGPGENPMEIYAMAEAFFRNGSPLPRIKASRLDDRCLHLAFDSQSPVLHAELNYTTDEGVWAQRHWQTEPAVLDAEKSLVSAVFPMAATAGYINLVDARNCVTSSEHVTFSTSGPL